MKKDQQVSFAIYVLIVLLVVVLGGTLVFLLGRGPKYVTPQEIQTFVRSQPTECQPIIRARLQRKLVQGDVPLRPIDIRTILREVDGDDCRLASQQLEVLQDVEERIGD